MLTNDERWATKTLRLTRYWQVTSFALVTHQLRPSSLVIRPFVPFVFQNLTTPQSLL
jgi:hypothetical protein